jgi:very-short-patch-repair endonuclease
MELISPALRIEFREFCVSRLILRQIDDIFSLSGAQRITTTSDRPISGERRMRVEEYYASLDWTNGKDAQTFLSVISLGLAQSYISEEDKTFLRELCIREGFVIDGYKIYLSGKGVESKVKNLIFAADGPKPEIVLSDSVSNDIEIVKNAEFCLVYNKPILEHDLLWKELIDWYCDMSRQTQLDRLQQEKNLYSRLRKSLTNEPERFFFRTYFEIFREPLGDRLPALIPQVYLHYDPYTISQLVEGKRLVRQRMDFLFLFSNRTRVVIEIDGKQHYAEGDIASPKLYAEMVAEDRRLKLAGYEVYRFGGHEFQIDMGKTTVKKFFQALIEKYTHSQH